MSVYPMKRFWREVSVRELPEGFGISLDEKSLMTPGKQLLAVPTGEFAAQIAIEWEAVEKEVEPELLRFTKVANTAIDRVSSRMLEVVDDIVAYGEADLICYRAREPEDLKQLQAKLWNPWLDWSQTELGAPLHSVAGIGYREQPMESLVALRNEVARHSVFELVPLNELVTISGSLILALAVSRGALTAPEAWPLSRLDEEWQAEQWGRDELAAAAASQKREAFLAAETVLGCLRGSEIKA